MMRSFETLIGLRIDLQPSSTNPKLGHVVIDGEPNAFTRSDLLRLAENLKWLADQVEPLKVEDDGLEVRERDYVYDRAVDPDKAFDDYSGPGAPLCPCCDGSGRESTPKCLPSG